MYTALVRTFTLVLMTSTASVAFAGDKDNKTPPPPKDQGEQTEPCTIPHEADFRANLKKDGFSDAQIEKKVAEQKAKLCGDSANKPDKQPPPPSSGTPNGNQPSPPPPPPPNK